MPRMILDDLIARGAGPTRRGPALAILAGILPVGVGLASLRYGLPGRPGALPIPNAALHPVALALHAVPAALALIIAPLQLTPGLRARRPGLHRALGRAYAVLVPVGGLAALWIAPDAQGGLVSAAGFTALALAWMTTSAVGVEAARRGRIAAHRAWMTRSAALTFAAVTLRLYLPLAMVAGLPFTPAYRAISWLCWLPNLLVAEAWLRSAGRRGARSLERSDRRPGPGRISSAAG